MHSRLLPLSVGLSLLATPAQALETAECTDAHFAAQVARAEGRLLEAQEQLSRCGDPTCPGVLTQECGEWLKQVSEEIPSIVFVIQDLRERDIMEFDLQIDGAQREEDRSGSVRLNPGKHEILVRAAGYVERRQVIRLRVGEKHRRVRLLLAEEFPEAEQERSPIWPLLLAGGVTVLGATGFGYFGLTARRLERDLEECRPSCSESAVDKVRTHYTLANVALGAGVAALAAGGLYWSLRDSGERSQAAVGLGLHGGTPQVSFRGRF